MADRTRSLATRRFDLAGRYRRGGQAPAQSAGERAERLEAKILLARALERMGKLPLAARELQQVAQARPDSPGVELELARLNQQMQSYSAALEQLKRVVENPAATPTILSQAATLLAAQGENQLALSAMLKQRDAAVPMSLEDLLLLARLYDATGQTARAESLIPQIERQPDTAALAWLADWYARQGQSDKARAAPRRPGRPADRSDPADGHPRGLLRTTWPR